MSFKFFKLLSIILVLTMALTVMTLAEPAAASNSKASSPCGNESGNSGNCRSHGGAPTLPCPVFLCLTFTGNKPFELTTFFNNGICKQCIPKVSFKPQINSIFHPPQAA